MKTFRYRLYPSKRQSRLLEQTVETCRLFYNDCLAERKEAWDSERHRVTKVEQLRRVKELKATNPRAANIHSHSLQVAVADLDRAFRAFFRRVKAGEKPGYPRFKGCDRFDSFGLKEYGNGWKVDGRRLRVSGIGRIPVRWHRPLEGTPKTLRVVRRADGWYACIPHPHWYREEQRRLRVLQRRVARRKKGGSNRRKAVQALRLRHQHIGNRRKDFLAKLALSLIRRYDVIAIEDLRVTNMARNRHLAKSIMDSGWGHFRQHLALWTSPSAGSTVPAASRSTEMRTPLATSLPGRDAPVGSQPRQWPGFPKKPRRFSGSGASRYLVKLMPTFPASRLGSACLIPRLFRRRVELGDIMVLPH